MPCTLHERNRRCDMIIDNTFKPTLKLIWIDIGFFINVDKDKYIWVYRWTTRSIYTFTICVNFSESTKLTNMLYHTSTYTIEHKRGQIHCLHLYNVSGANKVPSEPRCERGLGTNTHKQNTQHPLTSWYVYDVQLYITVFFWHVNNSLKNTSPNTNHAVYI